MDDELIVRLRAELAAAEERYRLLADNSHDIISRIDAEGRVTFVSPSVRRILGYEPEELVGQNGFAFLAPEELDARRAAFEEGIRSGEAPVVATRARRKDGSYIWMEYWTEALKDEHGRVCGFQSTSRDVTARRAAEEALKTSEQNFESFVMAMPVPAIIHKDGRVVVVNHAFAEVFGHGDDLVGRPIFDVVAPADRSYVEERINLPAEVRAGSRTREHRLLHRDGTFIPVEVTVVPVFFRGQLSPMGVIHDLRERKRLEAQLMTADRMSSLGRLSAAVGHEINNPLAYVLGSVSLIDKEIAQLGFERSAPLRELLSNVQEGAERIRKIVLDLKALSREQNDERLPVDLGRVLDLCASMADHEIRHRGHLVKDYADLPLVLGSDARLGQVFLNLLVNAAQSLPEGNVETNEVRIVARALEDTVVVEVVDSGGGIPPEVMSRIFEPFFTTKPGGGTGLGLSISHNIITALGGTITALANEPRGARLRVVLKCAPAESATSKKPSPEFPPTNTDARILIIDDEPLIAQMVARFLRPHPVTIALGGRSALEQLEDDAYDVIVCDLHMNDVSGMDVYDHVKRDAPSLVGRFIFMTGGAMSTRAHDFVQTSTCRILEKPFDPLTLLSAVEQVLTTSRR